MAEVFVTVRPTGQGGDYTTVAAAVSDNTPLAAGDWLVVEVQGDWSSVAVDGTGVVITSATFGDGEYIEIRADQANAFDGTFDAAKYRRDGFQCNWADSGLPVDLRVSGIQCVGGFRSFSIENNTQLLVENCYLSGASNAGLWCGFGSSFTARDCVFSLSIECVLVESGSNLLERCTLLSTGGTPLGIVASGGLTRVESCQVLGTRYIGVRAESIGEVIAINCLVAGHFNERAFVNLGTGGIIAQNCTAVALSGIGYRGVECTNCIGIAELEAFEDGTNSGNYNASDDGSAPGANSLHNIPDPFINAGAGDYRLNPSNTSGVNTGGVDLSNATYPVTHDAFGTPRPNPPSIGYEQPPLNTWFGKT